MLAFCLRKLLTKAVVGDPQVTQVEWFDFLETLLGGLDILNSVLEEASAEYWRVSAIRMFVMCRLQVTPHTINISRWQRHVGRCGEGCLDRKAILGTVRRDCFLAHVLRSGEWYDWFWVGKP